LASVAEVSGATVSSEARTAAARLNSPAAGSELGDAAALAHEAGLGGGGGGGVGGGGGGGGGGRGEVGRVVPGLLEEVAPVASEEAVEAGAHEVRREAACRRRVAEDEEREQDEQGEAEAEGVGGVGRSRHA